MKKKTQSNLFITATLQTEESNCCREVAIMGWLACSSLSVSGDDRKSGRVGSARDKERYPALSFSLPDATRRWSRSSPARFFDRPHWPRAWNRLSGGRSVIWHRFFFFAEFNTFILRKLLSVAWKYATQSKSWYINKTETKQRQRQTTRGSDQVLCLNEWTVHLDKTEKRPFLTDGRCREMAVSEGSTVSKIYMLLVGCEVRIMKTGDQGLENAGLGQHFVHVDFYTFIK